MMERRTTSYRIDPSIGYPKSSFPVLLLIPLLGYTKFATIERVVSIKASRDRVACRGVSSRPKVVALTGVAALDIVR